MTPALLALAALAAPIVAHRRCGDVCAPPAIAASLWCGTLALYTLRLLPYPPLQRATAALLAATIVLLVAGSAAASWWWARRRPAAASARLPLPRASWWIAAYAVIALAGTAWFVVTVVTTLPTGFADAVELRRALFTQRIPSTFLFAQLFAIATPLVTLALALGGSRPPWPIVALGLGCAAGTVLSTDRTQVFLLLMSAAFMTAYRVGPGLSLRRAALVVGVVGALLVGAFLAVETWVRKSPAELGLFLRLPGMTWVPGEGAIGPGTTGAGPVVGRAAQRLAGMYMYATGSYGALDRLIADPPPRTYGAHVLFPLIRPFERLGVLNPGTAPSPIPGYADIYPQPAPGLSPMTFNAYTFLYYPLVDFGAAGALVYALIVALLAGGAYGWMREDRRDPLRLLVAGQVATAFALTIFVNKFNNTAWWYVLGLTVLPWLVHRGWRRTTGYIR